MARRGQNSGSIYQRADGRWVAVITLPAQDGTRTRQYFYGDTRRAVQQQLTAALRDQQQGLPMATERQTVEQFLDTWLTRVCRPAVQPSTEARYTQLKRRHILPSLGHQPLTRLTSSQLTALYDTLLENGVSPRIVQHIHAMLRRALEQAVRWRLIARNPAIAVEPPRPQPREAPVLGLDQLGRFLEVARADRLYALYVLAIMTGMRQGELCGLRWADIVPDWSRVEVRHTLQRMKGTWSLEEPKTGPSRRTIKLSPTLVQVLKAHRARQNEQRLALGTGWEDHGLVFTNAVGRPLEARNLLARSYARLLAQAGLPKIRFHDLRHTYATLALLNGEKPKVVQETLGHASITLTMDTYSHLLPDMQDDAAARMERLLGRATGS